MVTVIQVVHILNVDAFMFVFRRSSQCTGMTVVHVIDNVEMTQPRVSPVLKGGKKVFFI